MGNRTTTAGGRGSTSGGCCDIRLVNQAPGIHLSNIIGFNQAIHVCETASPNPRERGCQTPLDSLFPYPRFGTALFPCFHLLQKILEAVQGGLDKGFGLAKANAQVAIQAKAIPRDDEDALFVDQALD